MLTKTVELKTKTGDNGIYQTKEGEAYAAGFFQSQLAALLADTPAHKQMEVIQILVQRSLED